MIPEERKKLRKYLRWGDIKKIAVASKMHTHTVRRWFEGDYENSAIEPYIIAIVEKRKQEVENSINGI